MADSHELSGVDEAEITSPPAAMDTQPHKDGKTLAESAAAVADEASSADEADAEEMPADEASALKGLTADIQDQADVERNITNQARQALTEHEDERDQKRIDRSNTHISKLRSDERKARQRLANFRSNPLMQRRITTELEKLQSEIEAHQEDITAIQKRIDDRHRNDGKEQEATASQAGNQRLPDESQRDFLLRTGKITPFSAMRRSREGIQGGLEEILLDAEEEVDVVPQIEEAGPKSHRDLKLPGFGAAEDSGLDSIVEDEFHLRPRKKRRIAESSTASTIKKAAGNSSKDDSAEDFNPTTESEEDSGFVAADGGINAKGSKRKHKAEEPEEKVDLSGLDDGKEENYQRRLQDWIKRRSRARDQFTAKEDTEAGEEESEPNEVEDEEEWHKPCPDPATPDHLYDEGIKLPGEIYSSLFDYQKVGVQWLGEMFEQKVGGILADEMGLGKTIQVISFLAGLHFSKKLDGPVIVVAPATVLSQWVKEFHQWWPPLRVSILHSSGSGMLNVRAEEELEEADRWDDRYGKRPAKSSKSAQRIAATVLQKGHVLVTTYSGLQTYRDILTPITWAYAVLDEGHKIRNPEASITYSCKSLRTSNRLILSGTPMQNNLVELWSLFDFVYPMRLGNLVNFRYQFDTPIKHGSYQNASNLQILAAEKCARTLKDTISPYMLQRMKVNVASDLPKKTEQVLFCKLTKPQRQAYEMTLASPEIASVMNGKRTGLWGIDLLTKICNHPDLLDPLLRSKPGYKWGSANKSGKMQVVKNLLGFWKNKRDKVLLFTQGKLMLNILEDFMKKLGYKYLRMDGSTRVKDRQALVDQFNNDPDLYVFLLTTKVGGLGVNLTGANRVIIFDPNWNPATDMQARERAWRLGQKREVTIFRLMTAGAIEEKIYHRQIYKQFLNTKVITDATVRSSFTPKDLLDMFTLTDTTAQSDTETAKMFKGTEVKFDSASSTPRESPIPTASNHQSPTETPPSDLTHIDGIASTEAFPDEKPETDEERDQRLMRGLFERSGVHSAHSHDEIINGKVTADPAMLEREADRIAREAGNELRRAGEEARNIPAGQVTWTGTQGESGRPSARRTAGPSSAGILANLEDRQNTNANSNSRVSNIRTSRQFANLITQFIKLQEEHGNQQGKGIPSKMIVDHFNPMCRDAREKKQFTDAFTEVCVKKADNRRRDLVRWGLKSS